MTMTGGKLKVCSTEFGMRKQKKRTRFASL